MLVAAGVLGVGGVSGKRPLCIVINYMAIVVIIWWLYGYNMATARVKIC